MSDTIGSQPIPELDKLGPADAPVTPDALPAKPKRKRTSGTSGAERARRAREAAGTASSAPKPRAPRSRSTSPKIADGMANLYTMAGMALSVVPSPPAVAGSPFEGSTVAGAVGQTMVSNSGELGKAWEQAAKDDPRIREALERLLTVSTVGQIVAAHAPLVIAGLMASGTLSPALLAGAAAGMAGAPDGQNTGGRP